MSVLLEPGDHVVATFPGYQSLYQLAADRGCEVGFWRPEERADGWHFDLEGLRAALRPSTRLVVVNVPHNPTGALPTEAEFAALVDLVAESGARLFCDEMYRFLELSAQRRLPSAVELSASAVVLCGLSKSFAAPGLRLGGSSRRRAACAPRRRQDYTTICAAPGEVLGVMVLRDRDRVWRATSTREDEPRTALERFAATTPILAGAAPPLASICFRAWSCRGAARLCTRLSTRPV
jgi:aspartate/methionine/tyrosine aminotransferase